MIIMDKSDLQKHILETYGVSPDHPWESSPTSAVFRHSENNKWFALVMDIPRSKLGLSGGDNIDVVNLKCDPVLIGSLRLEKGFFPAYHMNKENWITAALDGSADSEKLKSILGMSFDLTSVKIKKRAKHKT